MIIIFVFFAFILSTSKHGCTFTFLTLLAFGYFTPMKALSEHARIARKGQKRVLSEMMSRESIQKVFAKGVKRGKKELDLLFGSYEMHDKKCLI